MEQLRYVARAAGADSSLLVEEAAQALAMFARDPQALLVACKQLLSRQPTVGGLWWLCSRLLTASDPLAEARAVIGDVRSDQTSATLLAALETGRWHAATSRESADGLREPGFSTDWFAADDFDPEDSGTVGRPRVVVAGWPDTAIAALAQSQAFVLVIEVDGVGHGAVRRLERLGVEAEVVAAERVAGAVAASDVVLIEAAAVGPGSALVEVGGVALAAVASALERPVWLVSPSSRLVPEVIWPDVKAGSERWNGPEWMAPSELLPLSMVGGAAVGSDFHRCGGETLGANLDGGWAVAPELIGVGRSGAT